MLVIDPGRNTSRPGFPVTTSLVLHDYPPEPLTRGSRQQPHDPQQLEVLARSTYVWGTGEQVDAHGEKVCANRPNGESGKFWERLEPLEHIVVEKRFGSSRVPPSPQSNADEWVRFDVSDVVGAFAELRDEPELVPDLPAADGHPPWLAAFASRGLQDRLERESVGDAVVDLLLEWCDPAVPAIVVLMHGSYFQSEDMAGEFGRAET